MDHQNCIYEICLLSKIFNIIFRRSNYIHTWLDTVCSSSTHTFSPGSNSQPFGPQTSMGSDRQTEKGESFLTFCVILLHFTFGHFLHSLFVTYPCLTSSQTDSKMVLQLGTSSITSRTSFFVSQTVV